MASRKKSTSKRGRRPQDRAQLKPQDGTLGLEVVHPNAAGIDVGNEEHWVAVPPRLDAEPVRRLGCFTADLKALAQWLKGLGIDTVAMQSTGVYWIALYEVREQHGIRVFLVNARDTQNLPGHKTDIQECQWLLKLHVYGLLKNSFRPQEEICVMGAYWRQRQQHIADAGRCIQRMQKALTQMNLQLANVLSDISGWTGQASIQAILDGERDPHKLAELRDPRVKATPETIVQSLEGNWRKELLFVLRPEFKTYQSFQTRIGECDQALQEHYQSLAAKADPEQLPKVERNKRPRGKVPESFDLRDQLYRITGVDLTAIEGINVLTAQTVIAEVGHDMSRFKSEAHFVSFLSLCPNHKVSGGKVIGRDRRTGANRAGLALRNAAGSLLRSQTYLGAQYRRLRAKLGAPQARKAMANQLARIVYRLLKYGQSYVDKGAEFYERKYRQQQVQTLARKAASLGFQLQQSA
jgi:transposase